MILRDVIDNTIISFGPKYRSKESGSEHSVSWSSDNIHSLSEIEPDLAEPPRCSTHTAMLMVS
jgi:hypothetical protein